MNRKGSRDSQATFSGKRQSPTENWVGQNINLRDFETFEPNDAESNSSSVIMPTEMKRRFQHDMHLQLDDLDMPSQSMTLSSLSQSQMQGRSARSYLSGVSNNQPHQSSIESQVPSGRTNSNLSLSNSHFDTNEKFDKNEDSPGFGRPNELVSVTDELTVSKSDIDENLPPYKNQNRTFADSVINHQLNGLLNINAPQTDQKKGALLGAFKTVDSRQKSRYQEAPYLLGTTADLLDQSDLSDLDLLTRTQISHNLVAIDPNARSRIISLELSQSQITVPSDPSLPPTHRANNLMKRLVDDASDTNLTPDSQNSIQWQFKDNPIQQLKQKIKQSNLQKKGRDIELYEALESNQSQVHRANSDLQQQNQELMQSYQQLAIQNNAQQNQIKELQTKLQDQQTTIQGLESQTAKLNQTKPGSDLLRMRALEAARQDNKELRENLEKKKEKVSELEQLIVGFETQAKEWKLQCEKMELDKQKQAILVQGLRREMEEQKLQQGVKQQDVVKRIDTQNTKLEQTQYELQNLQLELQQRDKQLLDTTQHLETKQSKIKQFKLDVAALESKNHSLQVDLSDWQTRARELEDMKNKPAKSNSFDQELQRIKDKHQIQVAKLQDEVHRLQTLIGERDAILTTYQAQSNTDNERSDLEIQVRQLENLVQQYKTAESKHAKLEQKYQQEIEALRQTQKQIESPLKSESPSQFTKNLLSQKEIEIQNLKDQLNQLEQLKWHAEQETEETATKLEIKQSEMHELQRELGSLRKTKQMAEQSAQDSKNKLRVQVARYEELCDKLAAWQPVDCDDLVLQRLTDQYNDAIEQAVENKSSECQMLETQCKRQQDVIKQLEQKMLKSTAQSKPMLIDKSVQKDNQDFLAALELVVNGDAQLVSDQELAEQIQSRLKQDLSCIEGNELQEKSGKYEALLFLQQIGEGEKLEIVQKQLMEELQLKQDEYEIEYGVWEQSKKQWQIAKQSYEMSAEQSRQQHEQALKETCDHYEHKILQLENELKVGRGGLGQEISSLRKELMDSKQKHERVLLQKENQHKDDVVRIKAQLDETLSEKEKEWKQMKKDAIDKAVVAVRSELMNKMSELKNEHLRVQAEWQRQQSQQEEKQREVIDGIKKEWEKQCDDKVREAKVVVERIHKKQLNEMQQRIEDCNKKGLLKLQQADQDHEQSKQQLQQDMKRLQKQLQEHKQQDLRSQQKQHEQQQLIKNLEQQLSQNNKFVEQLKLNFEQELINQEQNTEMSSQSPQSFAEVIILEMEKILVTLTCQDKQEVNAQRQKINKLIKAKLHSECRQMFEQVKNKISSVLATLKRQLLQKYQREDSISSSVNQSVDVRQSTSSSEVVHNSPVRQSNSDRNLLRNSELKNYIEYQECTDVMSRLQPQQQNSKGAVVVEVSKVVRDLQMLYETTKMAKFCRVLLGTLPESPKSQQNPVQVYRDQLNNFFKLITRLNQASEQVCQDSEVFRLRLLNVELNQRVYTLQKEQQSVVTRALVQEVISYWQPKNCQQVKPVLESLEQLHFQISKNQFKLNQLADLFTESGCLNTDTQEVIQKCEEFTTMDEFLESSFQNNKVVEMMSPNETAQLIATVISQLPNQTVHSEIKQALSMINESMPPLQQPKQHHRLHTQQPSHVALSTQRSRSTNINMPRQMPYQTVEQTRFLSQAETLIQSEEDLDNSVVQHQSSLDEELAYAQNNVNHLFEKVKGNKFNTLQY